MITFKLKVNDACATEAAKDIDDWADKLSEKVEKLLTVCPVSSDYLHGVADTLKLLRMARA